MTSFCPDMSPTILFYIPVKFAVLHKHLVFIGVGKGSNISTILMRKILFEGTPEELVKNKESYTAQFLKMELN
jgi:hypothetical protein